MMNLPSVMRTILIGLPFVVLCQLAIRKLIQDRQIKDFYGFILISYFGVVPLCVAATYIVGLLVRHSQEGFVAAMLVLLCGGVEYPRVARSK